MPGSSACVRTKPLPSAASENLPTRIAATGRGDAWSLARHLAASASKLWLPGTISPLFSSLHQWPPCSPGCSTCTQLGEQEQRSAGGAAKEQGGTGACLCRASSRIAHPFEPPQMYIATPLASCRTTTSPSTCVAERARRVIGARRLRARSTGNMRAVPSARVAPRGASAAVRPSAAHGRARGAAHLIAARPRLRHVRDASSALVEDVTARREQPAHACARRAGHDVRAALARDAELAQRLAGRHRPARGAERLHATLALALERVRGGVELARRVLLAPLVAVQPRLVDVRPAAAAYSIA